jgi:hypothetical protein
VGGQRECTFRGLQHAHALYRAPCCVATPEAGLVANWLAVRGCPPGLFPARPQGGAAPEWVSRWRRRGCAGGGVRCYRSRLMTLSAHVR